MISQITNYNVWQNNQILLSILQGTDCTDKMIKTMSETKFLKARIKTEAIIVNNISSYIFNENIQNSK